MAGVEREPQVLPFVDPKTGSQIVLVACMHYNPRSVSKAERVTRQVCEQGALGAVVLEMCAERYEALEDGQPAGSTQRWLLDNEFQAAADVATAGGCPVVLGDQPIEEISDNVAQIMRDAVSDLASPFDGGWQ